MSQFDAGRVSGVREEPQLREQDFGNFQDVSGLQREKSERESYGRFFYRFPNGESGADVYDRYAQKQPPTHPRRYPASHASSPAE